MLKHAAKQSFQVWWNNLVHLTLFNFLWVICQLLIVTGPPATATVYILVEKVMQGDLVTLRDAWTTFRAMFVTAWKWGLCNLAMLILVISYLWWAQTQSGVFALAVSFFALIVLAFWLTMNLFYWPLWLAQSDSSLGNTFRNAFVLVISNPGSSLGIFLISVGLIIISGLTILPLIHCLMIWLALFGLHSTQALIKRIPSV